MINSEAAERFMAAPWLAEIDRETKTAILNTLVEAKASPGAVLLQQGQLNDHLSFLMEGSVSIERTFPSGRRDTITTLTAPTVFGTTTFFLPKPPNVTVRATSDVWIFSLYHPAHEALRAANPRAAEALALAVIRALSERFDLIDQLFSDLSAKYAGEPVNTSEWARFRSRLFEERGI
jgi:CRP-like cAMP-binding protein